MCLVRLSNLGQRCFANGICALVIALLSGKPEDPGEEALDVFQRIDIEAISFRHRDAVALWTEDGEITIVSTSAAAGNYIGNGDPDDPATCPEPSGDTSSTGQQGTLCTFFKYVSGGLQPANKFVSLSPAYKTKFGPVRDDDGQWKSSVYFECHYFDVSLNPATGLPFWTAKSHVDLSGEAKKVGGRWLFTHVSSSAVPVPVP